MRREDKPKRKERRKHAPFALKRREKKEKNPESRGFKR